MFSWPSGLVLSPGSLSHLPPLAPSYSFSLGSSLQTSPGDHFNTSLSFLSSLLGCLTTSLVKCCWEPGWSSDVAVAMPADCPPGARNYFLSPLLGSFWLAGPWTLGLGHLVGTRGCLDGLWGSNKSTFPIPILVPVTVIQHNHITCKKPVGYPLVVEDRNWHIPWSFTSVTCCSWVHDWWWLWGLVGRLCQDLKFL